MIRIDDLVDGSTEDMSLDDVVMAIEDPDDLRELQGRIEDEMEDVPKALDDGRRNGSYMNLEEAALSCSNKIRYLEASDEEQKAAQQWEDMQADPGF